MPANRPTTSMRGWMARVRNQSEQELGLTKLNLKFTAFSVSMPAYEMRADGPITEFKEGYNFRLSMIPKKSAIPPYHEVLEYLFRAHCIRFPAQVERGRLVPLDAERAKSWSHWASCYTLADDFPTMAIWRKMRGLDIPGQANFE